jgi:hypothetical protein
MMSRPLPLETCAPGSTGLLISRVFLQGTHSRRSLGVLPARWSRICSALSFCCISGSRVLRLILAHKSISPLNHALLCPLVHRTGVKIGLAKGYVSFALLKQRRVVHDSSPIGSHPGHFGLTRLELTYRTAQQHGKHSDRDKG